MAENLYKRGRIKDSAIILEFLGRGNKKDLEKKLKREFEGK